MKKSSLLLLIPLIVVLVLSGCVRKASTPPATTPHVIDVANTPLPVDQQILSATMTAQAIMQEFNMPTQIVQNPQGTPEVITQIPPTPIPVGTATPTPLPILQPMTKPTTWTVQSGETIYCLARRFDVDPGDMLAINNLYAGSMLNIGDVLDVPQTGSWPTDDRSLLDHPDTWNVQPGRKCLLSRLRLWRRLARADHSAERLERTLRFDRNFHFADPIIETPITIQEAYASYFC